MMRTLIQHGPVRLQRLAIPTLLGVLALASLGGCGGSSDGESSATAALTENDFALDASVVADPERGVVVNLLESAGSTPPEQDTGDVGSDVIPYAYASTVTNTFCWDDDDLDAAHVMTVVDSAGADILRLQPNGACVTAVIEPGSYSLRFEHDGRSPEAVAVFIEPLDGASGGQPGVASNVETLLHTNKCIGCALEFANLAKARLANADLSGAGLSGANLSEAILSGANLDQARMARALLTGADLSHATMFDVNLSEANLHQATLSNARIINADLSGADLSATTAGGVQLYGSNLRQANLDGAQLSNAELERADLTGATLVGAEVYSAGLNRTQLVDADFTNADLEAAQLCEANIAGAKFGGATLAWTVWADCRQCTPESIGVCTHFPLPPPTRE